MSVRRLNILRRAATVPVVVLAASIAVVTTPVSSYAATPKPPVTLPTAIEPMPPYQPQTVCDPWDKPGVKAFGQLLVKTYPDTSIVSISRACDPHSKSEHYEGRALDWGAYYKNAHQVAEVKTVFSWLFATDAHGNKDAMLRRLGIMYIIWNQQIWGVWSQKWEPYACSGETACHQNHVHFSFDWSGARKRTSFWTGKAVLDPSAVAPYVYTATSWVQTSFVSAKSLAMTTPYQLKAGLRYLFTVSGTYHYASGTTQLADAECSQTTKGWSALAPGDASSTTGNLDLWVNSHRWWNPTTNTGGGCNTKTHTYTRVLTFPATGYVQLALHDAMNIGRSGSLTVTVTRLA
jgi:hypothetical protein